MSSHFYRQKHSRRRLAALNFLSNISLDGSVQDPKFDIPKNVPVICGSLIKVKEGNQAFEEIYIEYSAKHNKDVLRVRPQTDSNDQTTCLPGSNFVASEDEEERRNDSDDLFKRMNTSLFRERSSTLDTVIKGQRNIMQTGSGPSLLVPPGVAVPVYTEKSIDCFEPSTPGYLLPSSHCRKVSSNASESSYSPTGSGLKEKEVQFLTSTLDWPNQMTDQRLVLVTCSYTPVVLFSTLPFSRVSKLSRGEFRGESGRRRHASSNTRPVSSTDYPDLYQLLGLAKPEDGQVISYCQMLVPSGRDYVVSRRLHFVTSDPFESDCFLNKQSSIFRNVSHDSAAYRSSNYARPASPQMAATENTRTDSEEHGNSSMSFTNSHLIYHPSLLDDPELIAGKHSTRIALLTFSSYMTSVIDYVKPSDLKKELNEKFREKFPHIHLTLSKIRSLKREMRKVAKQDSAQVDLLTIAQSYVYFEKLVLRGLVHKGNRKQCAGASLLLSAKMNDVKGDALKNLIEEIQNNFRIGRRELFASEFAVLVALEFSLHLPVGEVFSHYQRLLYDS